MQEIRVWAMYRLNNSRNGNPRYRLSTSMGDLITSSNSAFVYHLNNGWTDQHRVDGRLARVKLTRAGRISHLEWA